MSNISCDSCQCSRCDEETCEWCECKKGKPTEECFSCDCSHYINEQEDIDNGFLDGYE